MFKEHPDISSIAVMIGPEGGFSLEEVAKAEAFGFVRVSLGTAIFRAETAALFALNAISYHYDLSGEVKWNNWLNYVKRISVNRCLKLRAAENSCRLFNHSLKPVSYTHLALEGEQKTK